MSVSRLCWVRDENKSYSKDPGKGSFWKFSRNLEYVGSELEKKIAFSVKFCWPWNEKFRNWEDFRRRFA